MSGNFYKAVAQVVQLEALREEVLYVIFLDLKNTNDTLDRSR